jgi:hypothetical protein
MRGVPKEKAGIQDSGLVDHEMVAGARNHPNCLVLPFRLGYSSTRSSVRLHSVKPTS